MFRMPRLLPALLPLFCLVLASQAEARPVAATLYPSGAMVTEETEAVPVDGRIVLTLPAGADAASLSVSLSSGGVLSRTLALRSGQNAPAVKALRKEADALRSAIDQKQAELAGTVAMRQFWTRPPYSISAPSVEMANSLMERFAKESGAKLGEIAAQETQLRREIRDMERQASNLEARIRALGAKNADVQECVLFVDGTGSEPVDVHWTYWLEGANWKPQYRVAVESSTGQVRIAMHAALLQNSGMDWDGVALTLASADRLHSVEAPALRDWIIGGSVYESAPRAMLSNSAVRANAGAALPTASADEAGLTWSLGRMDLPASATVTRLVGLHELDAEFSRLLRPRQSADIWLYAALDTEALAKKPPLLLPAGQASFLVDGRETARGSFRFGPESRDVFFGIDQLMKAKVNEVASSLDGTQGSDSDGKSTTKQWSWNTAITSGHDKAVSLRVEEAAPIARDAGVAISVSTSPEAVLEAESSRYVWNLSIPARGKAELRYEVKAIIPEKP